jgi:hypothetical protein
MDNDGDMPRTNQPNMTQVSHRTAVRRGRGLAGFVTGSVLSQAVNKSQPAEIGLRMAC